MAKTFQMQILEYADRMHTLELNALLIEEVVKDLGLSGREGYFIFGNDEYADGHSYPGPYIKLYPRDVVDDLTTTLADAAKMLLSKVGRWDKGFDGDSNQLRLVGVYKGVRVVLVDTPPNICTVEVIEEEQHIPAYTGVRKRYVLKGDCDPLLEKVAAG